MACFTEHCICNTEPSLIETVEPNAKEPMGRRCAQIAISDQCLYVLGGYQFARYSRFTAQIVWAYNLASKEWTFSNCARAVGKEGQNWPLREIASFCSDDGRSNHQPAFLSAHFDLDQPAEAECLHERNNFYVLLKSHASAIPGSSLEANSSSQLDAFEYRKLALSNVDSSLKEADTVLDSGRPKVVSPSSEECSTHTLYFLSTMPSSSHQQESGCDCSKHGTLVSIYKLASSSAATARDEWEQQTPNWEWKCLTNYAVHNRRIVDDGSFIDRHCLDLFSRTLSTDADLENCFLHKATIWLIVDDGWACFPQQPFVPIVDEHFFFAYKHAILFDLNAQRFSLRELEADPNKGFPSRRIRHKPLVCKDHMYLLPGIETGIKIETADGAWSTTEAFSSAIWSLDLHTLRWKWLRCWQMHPPCVDYAAVVSHQEDCIYIFGGVFAHCCTDGSVFSSADDDYFHPAMEKAAFSNKVQCLLIGSE